MSNDNPNDSGVLEVNRGGDRPVSSEFPFGSSKGAQKPQKVVVLRLQARASGSEAKVFRVSKDRLVIGSVVSADVRLSSSAVAPIHAVIEVIPSSDRGAPEAVIYDLASETGVFVNGKKVVTESLLPRDKITIGPHELEFDLSDVESVRSKLVIESPLKEAAVREAEGRKLFLNADEDLSPLLLESDHHIEEIFDYRPTSKRALEVVMAWHGTVLDVEHFVKEARVTVGTTMKSDFGIPPLLSQKKYAILSKKGEGFVLNLDPQMKGVIQRQGKLERFDDLRALKGGSEIPLGNDDFAKVTVGEVDFYLSYTSAPPRLKRSGVFEKDPLFFKVMLGSLSMTALVLFGLSSMEPNKNIEAEQIPDRLATILYQPEKYVEKPKLEVAEKAPPQKVVEAPKPPEPKKPEPKPTHTVKVEVKPQAQPPQKKPAPKEMNVAKAQPQKKPPTPNATQNQQKAQLGQRGSKEGEGARAKGPEGKRGAPHAPKSEVAQNRASRPSPSSNSGGGAQGNSKVADIGNVDLLSNASAKITHILGNSAEKLGKGGGKFGGFGGFTTEGNGGLALSGNGRGGGGSSELAQGLGDKGTGGGRVGTGKGAAGNGNGIIGGQARVSIRRGGSEEAVVMGSIDADAIAAAIAAHADEFRLCYEKEINAEHPKLAGRVGTTFVIGSTGRVTSAGVESTTLKNPNAENCILSVIRRIDFPIPRGAGVVQVSYPFKFSPTGG